MVRSLTYIILIILFFTGFLIAEVGIYFPHSVDTPPSNPHKAQCFVGFDEKLIDKRVGVQNSIDFYNIKEQRGDVSLYRFLLQQLPELERETFTMYGGVSVWYPLDFSLDMGFLLLRLVSFDASFYDLIKWEEFQLGVKLFFGVEKERINPFLLSKIKANRPGEETIDKPKGLEITTLVGTGCEYIWGNGFAIGLSLGYQFNNESSFASGISVHYWTFEK